MRFVPIIEYDKEDVVIGKEGGGRYANRFSRPIGRTVYPHLFER